jgi:SAM-dependent methyltransferase
MMLQQLLNTIARQPAIWDAFRSVAEFGFTEDYKVIERELNPFGGDPHRRFLDFGCGTGQFARCFPADRYYGFDIAPHYVSHARRETPHRLCVMNGTAVGFADDTFDAALIMGVFHHLDDATVRACVQELHRILRRDGTILMLEDIPTQNPLNLPGRAMHWLDRGDNIRTVTHYQQLMEPYFSIQQSSTMLSGICDLAVYVMIRNDSPVSA